MLARRLAVVFALLAGFLGSQGPEFAQQYRQRLAGALDELQRIVVEFDAEAARENLTPAEGVERLRRNPELLARERGEAMAETIARRDRLEDELDAMATAGPIRRLYMLVKDFDPDVARRALASFEPAAPVSVEALTAAAFAAFWGWAGTHIVAWPIRRRRRAARANRQAA